VVYCQHRFENIFCVPVIISKTPVFAGVFDVFWFVTFFAPDADHRSIIRGSHGRECVGVGVLGVGVLGVGVCGCGSVWVCGWVDKDRDNASTVIVGRARQGERI